jgi:hypothetical protein
MPVGPIHFLDPAFLVRVADAEGNIRLLASGIGPSSEEFFGEVSGAPLGIGRWLQQVTITETMAGNSKVTAT